MTQWIRQNVYFTIALLLIGACFSGSLTWNSTGDDALALLPATKKLASTRTLTLRASGGAAPYSFTLSGVGSLSAIDTAGGSAIYAPTGNSNSAIVTVTDSEGSSAQSTITVPMTGSLDTDFAGSGVLIDQVGTVDTQANAVQVQSDGKVVIAGFATHITEGDNFTIFRYTDSGARDESFGTGGLQTFDASFLELAASGPDRINAMAIDSDGRLVLAGYGTSGDRDWMLARLNQSNGQLDTGFSTNGLHAHDFGQNQNDEASALSVINGNEILVTGGANYIDPGFGLAVIGVAGQYYGSAGAITRTFLDGGPVSTNQSHGLGVAKIGTHLVAIGRYILSGPQGQFFVVSWDFSTGAEEFFNVFQFPESVVTDDVLLGATVQSDGKLIVAGATGRILAGGVENDEDVAIARMIAAPSSASPDTSFSGDGFATKNFAAGDRVRAITVDSATGQLWFAGSTNTSFNTIVGQWNADGTPDTLFNGTGSRTMSLGTNDDFAHAITIDPEGRIVIAGHTDDSGVDKAFVARFWP